MSLQLFQVEWQFLLLVSICQITAFRVTTYEPTLIAIDDGGSVKLSCTVDDWYDRCTFKHKDRQCEFHYDDTAYSLV